MKLTDIAAPDYFHKVVDCQWACPAHTPVPEYIRLIAQGRYGDAYMINWKSNVFPGILGRTCDRPCEPACRRGASRRSRSRSAGSSASPPTTRKTSRRGCRRRSRRAKRNGKRIALVGAGPASLTVARDLAPMGYECVVFDGDFRSGGMMRSQIPKFRLPDKVIDEECNYILDLGVEFRGGRPINSLKKLLAEGWDAVFVGSGAPRGRELNIPGREGSEEEHPHRHRLALVGLVRPHQQDRQARHRARRRQHRDGLLPLLAPPRRRGREGDRALRLRGDEGAPVGKRRRDARGHPDPQLPRAEGIHPPDGKLTGVTSRR
jgi:hypothetical protein